MKCMCGSHCEAHAVHCTQAIDLTRLRSRRHICCLGMSYVLDKLLVHATRMLCKLHAMFVLHHGNPNADKNLNIVPNLICLEPWSHRYLLLLDLLRNERISFPADQMRSCISYPTYPRQIEWRRALIKRCASLYEDVGKVKQWH